MGAKHVDVIVVKKKKKEWEEIQDQSSKGSQPFKEEFWLPLRSVLE